MGDPRLEHVVRNVVLPKGFDQDLPTSVELSAQDAVASVSNLQRSSLVFDGCAKEPSCMLKLEPFDPVALGSCEQKSYHRVRKAAVDEVINDLPKDGFSTKLLEQSHLDRDPGSSWTEDQVASSPTTKAPSRASVACKSTRWDQASFIGSP